jgi:alpha-glucosidase
VLVCFADVPVPVDLGAGWEVEVASDGIGEGQPFAGTLRPDSALLLRPTT